jgi:tRNA pseudouridine55 synthase
MDGFLNLHKPFGWTSHDCVARVRRLFKTKKVGHAGTLDPAATGVLPIAIGRATRLLQYLPTGKAYRAIVRFGLTTATDDLEGEILTEAPCPELRLEQVEAMLPQFLGIIQQIPPAFSAIQVEGKRLYDLARAGVAVEVPMREVEVSKIDVLGWRSGEFPEVDLEITCGGGTYIRAIARDLGAALGVGATLAGLVRTTSSGFDLTGSWTIEDLTAALEGDRFTLYAVEEPLLGLPQVILNGEQTWRWCNGQKIAPPEDTMPLNQPYRVQYFNPATELLEFLGIGEVQVREEFTFFRAKMGYADCPCDRPINPTEVNPTEVNPTEVQPVD